MSRETFIRILPLLRLLLPLLFVLISVSGVIGDEEKVCMQCLLYSFILVSQIFLRFFQSRNCVMYFHAIKSAEILHCFLGRSSGERGFYIRITRKSPLVCERKVSFICALNNDVPASVHSIFSDIKHLRFGEHNESFLLQPSRCSGVHGLQLFKELQRICCETITR